MPLCVLVALCTPFIIAFPLHYTCLLMCLSPSLGPKLLAIRNSVVLLFGCPSVQVLVLKPNWRSPCRYDTRDLIKGWGFLAVAWACKTRLEWPERPSATQILHSLCTPSNTVQGEKESRICLENWPPTTIYGKTRGRVSQYRRQGDRNSYT